MISNEDRLDAIAIPLEWKADRLSRVPYGVFQRQDVYVREQKCLFRGRVWNYLCLEVEIPEIGDYVATYAGDTPVVVTRGHDVRSMPSRTAALIVALYWPSRIATT